MRVGRGEGRGGRGGRGEGKENSIKQQTVGHTAWCQPSRPGLAGAWTLRDKSQTHSPSSLQGGAGHPRNGLTEHEQVAHTCHQAPL